MSATITRRPDPRAVGGVLFALFFLAGDVLRGQLSSDSIPLPGAPAAEVVQYQTQNTAALFTTGSFQVASALSLLVFAGAVAAFVRRTAGDRRVLGIVATAATAVAGCALLVSALLSLGLTAFAGDWSLGTVSGVRTANFVSGGVVHVVTLGLGIGACTLIASKAKALPRGVRWLGYVASVPAILSVLSVPIYYASVLLPAGRFLGFAFCIAAGVTLLIGSRRSSSAPAAPAEV